MREVKISNADKLSVLKGNLSLWQKSYYNAKINVEVAEDIEDEAMKKGAVADMKRALVALDIIEAKTASIEKELENQRS